MDFTLLIKNYLPWAGDVIGYIFVIVAFIALTFFKILETVREIRRNSMDSEVDLTSETESFLIFNNREQIDYAKDMENPDYNQNNITAQVELLNIPENSTVSFKAIEKPVEQARTVAKDKYGNTDPFELVKSELLQDPEIENFSLFINPHQIFSGALREIFNKKINIVMIHLTDYKQKRFPFFKIEKENIQRFFLDDRKDIVIEELFELWRMGYDHPALPELFIHYYYSIRSTMANKILKGILLQGTLDSETKKRIIFLYQDILNCKTPVPEKANNPSDLFTIQLSLEISHGIKLTRHIWHKWENVFLHEVHEDRKGEYLFFFYDLLLPQISFVMNYLLAHKYKHILVSQWRNFIERQAFFHGHFEKLSRLSFIPPEYVSLISKSTTESHHIQKDLLTMLKHKAFCELHGFLVHYLDSSKELPTYEIEYQKINQWLKNLDLERKHPDYMPQAIRFILYLYFYQKKDLNKINYLTPYIHGRVGKFIPKLYQVRILFKNKLYEEAWHEMYILWNNDEENMLLMNETAVYAYHSGRINDAEELFGRLRALYPDNAQILHNEAVFLQHKARLVIENNKFSGVHIFKERLAW